MTDSTSKGRKDPPRAGTGEDKSNNAAATPAAISLVEREKTDRHRESVKGSIESTPAPKTGKPGSAGPPTETGKQSDPSRLRLQFRVQPRQKASQTLLARLAAYSARLPSYQAGEEKQVLEQLLEGAYRAIDEGLTEVAWQLSKEAGRWELRLMDDPAVEARMQSLLEETPLRLGPDVSQPITAMLTAVQDSKGEKVPGWRNLVREAMRLRDAQVDDLYAAKARVRGRLLLLMSVMLLCLLGLGLIFFLDPKVVSALFLEAEPASDPLMVTHPLSGLGAAVLLGSIGACLSAMMSFTFQKRAPDEFETAVITIVRPLIGATSGLIALLVASTGLITMGSQPATIGFLAFVFGFSERLVMGTVKRFEEGHKSDEDK